MIAAALVLAVVRAWDWNGYAFLFLIFIAVLYVGAVLVIFVVDRSWQSVRPARRHDAVDVDGPQSDDQDWMSRWVTFTRRPRVRAALIALLLILFAVVEIGDRV